MDPAKRCPVSLTSRSPALVAWDQEFGLHMGQTRGIVCLGSRAQLQGGSLSRSQRAAAVQPPPAAQGGGSLPVSRNLGQGSLCWPLARIAYSEGSASGNEDSSVQKRQGTFFRSPSTVLVLTLSMCFLLLWPRPPCL